MPSRDDIRNVAIVAHVDHGKTTLVDAMLWQSGAFRANQEVAERVMDSMDLEREKGFPILFANARTGECGRTPDTLEPTLAPLFQTLLEHVPAPWYDEGAPLQALVTNLDASPYVGRLALCRVRNGELRRGDAVAWCRSDGLIERAKIAA